MKGFVAFAALAVFVVGCAPARTVVGDWQGTPSKDMPAGSSVKATFGAGDALTMTMDMPQDLPGGKKINLHADVKGTYKLEGERMTMRADDVKFSGTGFPPEIKDAMEASLKPMGEQVKEKLNAEGSLKFAWVDDNSFTLTGKSGAPETFTRIK